MLKPIAFSAVMLLPQMATADVYRCQLPNGSRIIQTEPCSNASKTVSVTPIAKNASQTQEEQAAVARMANERQHAWLRQRSEEKMIDIKARVELESQQRQAHQRRAAVARSNSEYNPGAVVGSQPEASNRQNEYSLNNGGVMHQPQGSSYATDNHGNTYFKPPGSDFSYGPGGKTCFHFGAFADCK